MRPSRTSTKREPPHEPSRRKINFHHFSKHETFADVYQASHAQTPLQIPHRRCSGAHHSPCGVCYASAVSFLRKRCPRRPSPRGSPSRRKINFHRFPEHQTFADELIARATARARTATQALQLYLRFAQVILLCSDIRLRRVIFSAVAESLKFAISKYKIFADV